MPDSVAQDCELNDVTRALDLTVAVLTFNEEQNIPYLLKNVSGLAKEVIIIDSGSVDSTVEIAKTWGCKVFTRKFDNFSNQRNYALQQIEFDTSWVLVLDADEILTKELKIELTALLTGAPQCDAYYIKRRFHWMGKWVRRGYYPTWLLRIGRVGKIICDERGINEHLICTSGNVGYLKNDFIDENHKGIEEWVSKHNIYSNFEAHRLFGDSDDAYSFWRSQYERKRWIRVNVWNNLPLFTRPFALLFYRLFFQLALLDGRRVILYHFLHCFIYRFIIDAKYLEAKIRHEATQLESKDSNL